MFGGNWECSNNFGSNVWWACSKPASWCLWVGETWVTVQTHAEPIFTYFEVLWEKYWYFEVLWDKSWYFEVLLGTLRY